MNLAALPDLRAADNPLGPAVADDNIDLNNTQFLGAVQRAAGALRGQGVSAGDVVAIMLPNTASFVVSLFAAWRLGAAVTPINPSLTPAEVSYQVADAAAKVLIAQNAPEFDAGAPVVVTTDELDRGEPTSEVLDAPQLRGQRTGAAHLHERDDGAAEGRHARSREPECHVRRGDRRLHDDPATITACSSCRCSTSMESWSEHSRRCWPGAGRRWRAGSRWTRSSTGSNRAGRRISLQCRRFTRCCAGCPPA